MLDLAKLATKAFNHNSPINPEDYVATALIARDRYKFNLLVIAKKKLIANNIYCKLKRLQQQ